MTWVTYDSDSQRKAFRYTTMDGQPLFDIIFCNHTVQVMDISAGGLSFKNAGFKLEQTDRISLPIPTFLSPRKNFSHNPKILELEPPVSEDSPASKEPPRPQPMKQNRGLEINIKIIQIDRNDICHAIFEEITDEAVDILHQFVLERQKQDIRNYKIV